MSEFCLPSFNLFRGRRIGLAEQKVPYVRRELPQSASFYRTRHNGVEKGSGFVYDKYI